MVDFKVSLPKAPKVKSVAKSSTGKTRKRGRHPMDFSSEKHQVCSTTATEPSFIATETEVLDPPVQLPTSAAGDTSRRVAPPNTLYTTRESWLAPYDHRTAHDTRLHYQPWNIVIGNHYDDADGLEDKDLKPVVTSPRVVNKPHSGWSGSSRSNEPDVAEWGVIPDSLANRHPTPPMVSVKHLEYQSSLQGTYSPTSPFPMQVFQPESHDVHKFPLLTRFSPPPHYVPA